MTVTFDATERFIFDTTPSTFVETSDNRMSRLPIEYMCPESMSMIKASRTDRRGCYPMFDRNLRADTPSSSATARRNVSRCSRIAFRAFAGLRCTSA